MKRLLLIASMVIATTFASAMPAAACPLGAARFQGAPGFPSVCILWDIIWVTP